MRTRERVSASLLAGAHRFVIRVARLLGSAAGRVAAGRAFECTR